MTERERLLKLLKGEKPDRVPWFADLWHWYFSESGKIWNLFEAHNFYSELFELHKEVKAGMYLNSGSIYSTYYDGGVIRKAEVKGDKAVEEYITPIGKLHMVRKWSPKSFSWDIVKRMIESIEDLKILEYAVKHRKYRPDFDKWIVTEKLIGGTGLGFPNIGYTGLGVLISYYMGVENTLYATYDYPDEISSFIGTYNNNHLELVKLCCTSPAKHIIFSDNLSSDIQPPGMFMRYSYKHYSDIAGLLHKAGKTVSAHLDGYLNNIIGIVAKAGIDVADACTPKPAGDLSPTDIRKQSGEKMIIMGGVSPEMWLPETPEKDFIKHVKQWLDVRHDNFRIVQSAGDQVPPGTKLSRIKLMYKLVEEYGRF